MSTPPYARDHQLKLCHTCGQVCQASEHYCPRCDSAVHARKTNSLSRTWALLLASLIFYIPANLLPVMHTNIFGNASENTIMSGVVEFWKAGSWDIALLIFIASVVVPGIKFFVLGILLVTCQRR
ncbi:paraquat-inducible protein A, partial [Pseudomonas sp. BIOMIG1BDMA]